MYICIYTYCTAGRTCASGIGWPRGRRPGRYRVAARPPPGSLSGAAARVAEPAGRRVPCVSFAVFNPKDAEPIISQFRNRTDMFGIDALTFRRQVAGVNLEG